MYIKKISIIIFFLSLVACYSVENKVLSSDSQEQSELKVSPNLNLLKDEYTKMELPFDSKGLYGNNRFLNLNNYPHNQNDIKLFYSGEEPVRILMTAVKKIGNVEYLLSLIVVNFNDYEGGGPAQVIFLSGGENKKSDYENTLFISMGGKFPMLDDIVKFNSINDSTLKNYCIKSFVLNQDLSKKEVMECVGKDSDIQEKSFKFNTEQLGYDEIQN